MHGSATADCVERLALLKGQDKGLKGRGDEISKAIEDEFGAPAPEAATEQVESKGGCG